MDGRRGGPRTAHVRWRDEWRLPTLREFNGLIGKCDWTLTSGNDVAGYEVRGRGDYSRFSIFLPLAGWGEGGGIVSGVNVASLYRSSVPANRNPNWDDTRSR